MKILATDLDRTLLPNGHWKADSEAITLFNELTQKHDVLVVYVTGRNLALTENAIKEFGVRYPDILCGDVGTSIRKYENGEWTFDDGWVDHVKRESPRWNASAIRDAVAGIDGMQEQESEHLNQFKQSYYVEHEKRDQVLKTVNERIKDKFDEVI
ncbi:MAG TPA: HAD-IIB family hydrolase, partial [Gammaproteobacteria bacterium]